jgi:trans-feruloyl-CoA hydratase/vanillin synthase
MVTIPTYQTILVERDADGITTITFNRPEKRNAMNPQLHLDMYDVLNRLEGDEATRVLVLTGAGPAFCAGQDLKEYFHELEGQEAERRRIGRISQDWRDRILRMFPKPTIAMVNGYCFGGAFTIVCSCDFAIAAEDALFGLSEVNFGHLPGGLVSKVISGVLAYRDALYYALTGEPFDGRRAAEIKLVNKAVPREQLREETWKLARKLASMDASALRITKEALKQVATMDQEQAYYWLQAKSNELKWRHEHEGRGGDGIQRFLAKEYRPGLQSFTEVERA